MPRLIPSTLEGQCPRQEFTTFTLRKRFTAELLLSRFRKLSNNRKPVPRLPLAEGVAKYAGEAVSFVIADNRYLAQDAGEQVEVDYAPLESVVDPLKAR